MFLSIHAVFSFSVDCKKGWFFLASAGDISFILEYHYRSGGGLLEFLSVEKIYINHAGYDRLSRNWYSLQRALLNAFYFQYLSIVSVLMQLFKG